MSSTSKRKRRGRQVTPGQPVKFKVEGVIVKYEGTRPRKLRVQLIDGRLFRSDPKDLNIYSYGSIQWHTSQTGTSESNLLGCTLSWLDVENLQFCGVRTVIIYLESGANAKDTVETLAQLMRDRSDQISYTHP